MKTAVIAGMLALAALCSPAAKAWNCPAGQIRQQAPAGTPASTPYYDVVEGIAFICVPANQAVNGGNISSTISNLNNNSNSNSNTNNNSAKSTSNSTSVSNSNSTARAMSNQKQNQTQAQSISNSGNSSSEAAHLETEIIQTTRMFHDRQLRRMLLSCQQRCLALRVSELVRKVQHSAHRLAVERLTQRVRL